MDTLRRGTTSFWQLEDLACKSQCVQIPCGSKSAKSTLSRQAGGSCAGCVAQAVAVSRRLWRACVDTKGLQKWIE